MDWRRYLAEVPQAHAKRVRALLPQLLAVGAGAGPAQAGDSAVRFLLPALVQGAGAAEEAPDDDGAERSAWLEALQQPQVRITAPLICPRRVQFFRV